MYIAADTLDDVMNDVLTCLLALPFDVSATRGKSSELIGVLLHITNPRARLSRTETRGRPFSAVGELLWYLSGRNNLDFITYYISKYDKESEDGKTVYGGYGPRLFNLRNEYDQLENIRKLLKQKPSSRKAVIQLFDGADINDAHAEIPCTCTLQFLIRDGKLHLFVNMRSNDAFVGLPHDVFAFTMLQEIMARSLSVELGEYKHAVGSLHLYDYDEKSAREYLKEGFQPTDKELTMPPMPKKNPWRSIKLLLGVESKIRDSKEVEMFNLIMEPYWSDLARLLQIHSLFKLKNYNAIKSVGREMASPIYDTFIQKRLEAALKKGKAKKTTAK